MKYTLRQRLAYTVLTWIGGVMILMDRKKKH